MSAANIHVERFLDDAQTAFAENKPMLAYRNIMFAASMPIADQALLDRLIEAAGKQEMDQAALRALSKSPLTAQSIPLRFRLADLRLRCGDYSGAVTDYTELAKDAQNALQALQALCHLALFLDDIPAASAYLDQIEALGQDTDGAIGLKVGLLVRQGRIDDAEDLLAEFCARPGQEKSLHLHRVGLACRTGKHADIWRQMMDRKPAPSPLPQHELPRLASLEDARGKNVLVLAEQGFGDILQFVRFIPALLPYAETVGFYVNGRLERLLDPLAEGGVQIITSSPEDFLPDYICPILDLPYLSGVDSAEKLLPQPYLVAEPELVEHWAEKIGTHGFRVGIVWQGNSSGAIDYGRSIPLRTFSPLAEIEGVRLIALQKGAGIEQIAALPFADRIEVFDEMDSGGDAFIDTAAIASCLDLVVTTDTSVAHVVGALGIPAVLLLKFEPDWRWTFPPRDLTVWYENTLPLRQEKPGDWDGVIARLATLIRERMK